MSVGVPQADTAADHVALFIVVAMAGAVEGDIAQSFKLGFGSAHPRPVGWSDANSRPFSHPSCRRRHRLWSIGVG